MADVFISYANQDRAEAAKLSAYLEAQGWSVWWDRGLTAGDEFRDRIMQELGAARSAIVIWSPQSVGSNWVRSEAGRAQAQAKLIPVKMPGVAYAEIPPPFDVLHTEDAGAVELIGGAVTSLLAKPREETSWVRQSVQGARSNMLAFFGIFGAAITLFTGLKSLLDLADWARWLVDNWTALSHGFWDLLLSLVNLNISREWSTMLTFVVFCTSMAWSARRSGAIAEGKFRSKEMELWQLPALEKLVAIVKWPAALMAGTVIAGSLALPLVFGALGLIVQWVTIALPEEWVSIFQAIVVGAVLLLLFGGYVFGIAQFYKNFSGLPLREILLFIIAMMIVGGIKWNGPLGLGDDQGPGSGVRNIVLGSVPLAIAILMLSISPLRPLNRRLGFMLIALVVLVTLNALSVLELKQILNPPSAS